MIRGCPPRFGLLVSLALCEVICPVRASAVDTDNPRLAPILAQVPKQWWQGGWNRVDDLRRAMDGSPTPTERAEAQYWLACNYYALRQYDQALAEFQRLLETYQGKPETWAIRARAQYEMGQVQLYALKRYTEARAAYESVIKAYPEAEEATLARLMLAFTAAQEGKTADAIAAYEVVFQALPDPGLEASDRLRIELARGRFECGRLLMRQAQADRLSPSARTQLLTKALTSYKRALVALPSSEADLRIGVIQAIQSAFIALDGHPTRARQFLENQLDSGIPSADPARAAVPADPLAEF